MSATWILVWLFGEPGDSGNWTRASMDVYKGVGEGVTMMWTHPTCHCFLPNTAFSLSWSPEELSLSGLCQCLVELSTQPATVCHGSATTREAARGEAARRALQYLKIMAGSK